MDDRTVDIDPTAAVHTIDGVEAIAFSAVVERLRGDYPLAPPARIEAVLLREWEAFSAGRPLVVPVAVEQGVREILGPPAVG